MKKINIRIAYVLLSAVILLSSCNQNAEKTETLVPNTEVISETAATPDVTPDVTSAVTSDVTPGGTGENKTDEVTEAPTDVPKTDATPLPTETDTSVTPTPEPTEDDTVYTVRINEILASSDTVILKDGGMYDYIELYNYGDSDLALDKVYIGDGVTNIALNGVIIKKGGYYTIYASDELSDATDSYKHLPFKVSAGETITLKNKNGDVIDTVTVPEDILENYVLSYNGIISGKDGYTVGDYTVSTIATPGYENSIEGLSAYYKERDKHLGKLVINEAMTSNSKYAGINGKHYDWVEIKNISSEKVLLSDYYLSDSYKKTTKHRLPEYELGAGECVIIYATGGVAVSEKGYYTSFKLSNDGESLYIFDKDGNISDCAYLSGISHEGSYGRMNGEEGFFYFSVPTPGKENEEGTRVVATLVSPSVAPGVYNGVEGQLEITFPVSDDMKLYYTLDGSTPTEKSTLYDGGKISLEKTTVLRTYIIQNGRVPSAVMTYPYFINENHNLPVANIAIDPELMFGENGIYVDYNESIEHKGNLSFFEKDGYFSIDCGIELSGAGSRKNDKKSFRMKFRGKYGQSSLSYQLFGGDEITEFKSLRLRSGEDFALSIFGDELVAELASQCMNNTLSQNYRWCVLYINGEYFGIYAFRTDTKEEYLSEKYGVSEDEVNILNSWGDIIYGEENGFNALIKYVKNHDMSDPEHYKYISDRIDIDSLINWLFVQSFTGNRDTMNVRYYQIADGKWQWILYDFDWGYINYNHTMYVPKNNEYSGILARELFKNEEFLDQYLTTYGERINGVFSPENVLAEIEEVFNLMKDEVPRDRERWNRTYENWVKWVNDMKKYVAATKDFIIEDLTEYFELTDSQIEKYFSK